MSVRLTDLDPQFIRLEIRVETRTHILGNVASWQPGDPTEEITGPVEFHVDVDGLANAQGVRFLCSKCFAANLAKNIPGDLGTHSVICWFQGRGVPDSATPKPGRWAVSGMSLADLTLAPSVLLLGEGCQWHGFIQQGMASSV